MRRVLVIAVLLFAALAPGASAATFRAGAAVASIDPPMPVYAGGFGLSPPITRVHDPLEARALSVSNGTHAVAMAVVDAQAWFAPYQEGGDHGISGARDVAAKRIGGGL